MPATFTLKQILPVLPVLPVLPHSKTVLLFVHDLLQYVDCCPADAAIYIKLHFG